MISPLKGKYSKNLAIDVFLLVVWNTGHYKTLSSVFLCKIGVKNNIDESLRQEKRSLDKTKFRFHKNLKSDHTLSGLTWTPKDNLNLK